LLTDGNGDLLANGYRYLFDDAFLDVRRARNLLAHRLFAPQLAAANFRWALAAHLPANGFLVALAVRNRIFAALRGNLFPLDIFLAGNRVLLGHPFAAFAANGFASRDRLADGPTAFLVAGLIDLLVGGAADLLHDTLGDRLANRLAHFLVAGLWDLFADGLADFLATLLTDLFLDLMAALFPVRLVYRLADGIAAFFPAGLRDFLTNGVANLLPAGLVDGLIAGLADFFHDRLIAWLADRVANLLPAGLIDRLLAGLLDGLVAGFGALLVAGPAFLAVASFANLLHNRFLDRLVTSMPAFFQDFVIDQFVAGATLLLTGSVAALGITTRRRTTVVFGGTAMRCGRGLDGPEQADQCRQQRRSQVHPHDVRLLKSTRANCGNSSSWGSGSGVLKVRPSRARGRRRDEG
jgi:hypothetical protein